MLTVREHYDEVLSPYYSRMFGDFETKVGEQQALLERLATRAAHGDSMAVDLGCSSGFQSIALARLGFRVLAVDFSRRLLDELNERAGGVSVTAVTGDIRRRRPGSSRRRGRCVHGRHAFPPRASGRPGPGI